MWWELVIAVHMVHSNKYKNSGVNEHGPGSQLSVEIARGLPGGWTKRDHISSFSQLPDFQPFFPVMHICIGLPSLWPTHPSLFWWVFWIIRNETIERTPKSLSLARMWTISQKPVFPPSPGTKPSYEQKIRGVRDIMRILPPRPALRELPVLFYINRSF